MGQLKTMMREKLARRAVQTVVAVRQLTSMKYAAKASARDFSQRSLEAEGPAGDDGHKTGNGAGGTGSEDGQPRNTRTLKLTGPAVEEIKTVIGEAGLARLAERLTAIWVGEEPLREPYYNYNEFDIVRLTPYSQEDNTHMASNLKYLTASQQREYASGRYSMYIFRNSTSDNRSWIGEHTLALDKERKQMAIIVPTGKGQHGTTLSGVGAFKPEYTAVILQL